ncbi:MAG: ZIP family metal transporter [Nocardioidaceae bacterium]
MSLTTTLLLGFIAGATIVFGLPVGRMRRPNPELKLFLNAVAIGVLLFLVWDVLSAAWEPIDGALGSVHAGDGGLGTAFGYGVLFIVGVVVGMLSLVWYERWMVRKVASVRPQGPGTMTAGEVSHGLASWSVARRLSLLIAVGIGLHNFAEGLAIGQSAASGEIALAVMLVIGFGLHDATEGFGIVAPLAGDVDEHGHSVRPSWGFLLALGAIGGGPTFLGTIIGHGFTNEAVSVVFLTLAAGSILYVITQLIGVASRARRTDLLAYGLLLGLMAGFVTDAIVTAAGA